jgi:cytochrome c peroxidase
VTRGRRWQTPAAITSSLALGAFALASKSPRAGRRAVAVSDPSPSATPPLSSSAPADPPPPQPRVELGRRIFFDTGLSDPPGTSCATCHDPAHGYAGINGSSIGVARGSRPGRFARRNTPSVLYLRFVRRFHFHWEEDADFPEASGGFFWDGRSDSIVTLVQQPLLNPDEMGNRDLGAVARHLEASDYAGDLRRQFDGVFDSPESAAMALGECLEAFLTSREMSPFSSKYDDVVRGHAEMTPLEARGLSLFKDHAKGACSSCHKMDDRSRMPERSLFTDYSYDAVAPPRNRKMPVNADPRRFDLGLCERHEPKWHTDDDHYCGSFRTPSLRNVAVRTSFMHNGVFSTLRDVVAFYATRATDPKRWYPPGHFDDMPQKYWRYVNTNPAPYHRREGETPALDDADVDALVAFLETLTDRQYPRP